MIPSIGRIVHYTLTASDAAGINIRRIHPVAEGLFHGNTAHAGDVYPMMITRVWSAEPDEDTVVQGQVFLDGNDTLWVTSVAQGHEERQWFEPVRVHSHTEEQNEEAKRQSATVP
jgi:hypothetical protein